MTDTVTIPAGEYLHLIERRDGPCPFCATNKALTEAKHEEMVSMAAKLEAVRAKCRACIDTEQPGDFGCGAVAFAVGMLDVIDTPAPGPEPEPELCLKRCDKGSPCMLPEGHEGGHETEHECVFYDDPAPAPADPGELPAGWKDASSGELVELRLAGGPQRIGEAFEVCVSDGELSIVERDGVNDEPRSAPIPVVLAVLRKAGHLEPAGLPWDVLDTCEEALRRCLGQLESMDPRPGNVPEMLRLRHIERIRKALAHIHPAPEGKGPATGEEKSDE